MHTTTTMAPIRMTLTAAAAAGDWIMIVFLTLLLWTSRCRRVQVWYTASGFHNKKVPLNVNLTWWSSSVAVSTKLAPSWPVYTIYLVAVVCENNKEEVQVKRTLYPKLRVSQVCPKLLNLEVVVIFIYIHTLHGPIIAPLKFQTKVCTHKYV